MAKRMGLRGSFLAAEANLSCLQVMRDFCAEGAIKLGWDKVAVAGKCFPNDKELTTNMLAETFEAVWWALIPALNCLSTPSIDMLICRAYTFFK